MVSESRLKKHKDFQSDFAAVVHQVQEQQAVLARTLAWLIEGLNISEQWIVQVPDNAVANYLIFREGAPPFEATPPRHPNNAPGLQGMPPLNTPGLQGMPPLEGAPPRHPHTNNIFRLQPPHDAYIVEGVNRLAIAEIEDM